MRPPFEDLLLQKQYHIPTMTSTAKTTAPTMMPIMAPTPSPLLLEEGLLLGRPLGTEVVGRALGLGVGA